MASEFNLKDLESRLKELSIQKLNRAKHYGAEDLNVDSFKEWSKKVLTLNDPDMIRTALYYIFQPLFDRLVETPGPFNDSTRPKAIESMRQIYDISKNYLSDYYLGKPNIKAFRQNIGPFAKTIAWLDEETRYHTKYRNMSNGALTPSEVQSFILQYGEAILDGKLIHPDLIIGIACGASEIAFASAPLLYSSFELIRFSKRRYDDSIKLIPEIHYDLPARIKSNNITVVEDFVCTARSLNNVLKDIERYKPSKLIGASVSENSGGWGGLNEDIKLIINNSSFHIYQRKRG
ncbi:MAG: phosphoribosyltransferase [Candidatus Woesearchaeota archaeon]|nr:phosphoribosyltransferase [Candidatus Woesearchaeota archaeon]